MLHSKVQVMHEERTTKSGDCIEFSCQLSDKLLDYIQSPF